VSNGDKVFVHFKMSSDPGSQVASDYGDYSFH